MSAQSSILFVFRDDQVPFFFPGTFPKEGDGGTSIGLSVMYAKGATYAILSS